MVCFVWMDCCCLERLGENVILVELIPHVVLSRRRNSKCLVTATLSQTLTHAHIDNNNDDDDEDDGNRATQGLCAHLLLLLPPQFDVWLRRALTSLRKSLELGPNTRPWNPLLPPTGAVEISTHHTTPHAPRHFKHARNGTTPSSRPIVDNSPCGQCVFIV